MDQELARLGHALSAIHGAAVAATRADRAADRNVRLEGDRLRLGEGSVSLRGDRKIWVVGGGKAAAQVAAVLEVKVGSRIAGGLIVVKDGHGLPLPNIEVVEAAHPVPDERGEAAAQRVLAMVSEIPEDDLLIVVLTGGGSALLAAPADGITLEDKVTVTDQLLRAGAEIEEINAVRKHLSAIKGGLLARAARPKEIVTLLVSDVLGDPPDVIASGPTAGDATRFSTAQAVLKRYSLWEEVPARVRTRIEAGVRGDIAETPRPDDARIAGVRHVLLANNAAALNAAERQADELGYETIRLTSRLRGEAKEAGRFFGALAWEAAQRGDAVCFLAGGEVTVTLDRMGLGGRCQELALSAAREMDGLRRPVVLLAAGTDGTDGPTDAAGAFATPRTWSRAFSSGIDPEKGLREHDAYPVLRATADLFVTGPTGTNVLDLYLILAGDPDR
ncbi:MAG: DUF4147 domain-containing protein [Planctomycetota bacterium]